MTHWRTLTSNSQTISAEDLGERTFTVVIKDVEGVQFEAEDGSKDRKALIHFVGREKALAANTINCSLISSFLGDEVEGWAGHSISIAADKVEVRGALFGKPCVRVVGSPELERDTTVTIKLPRRKPLTRKLTKTARKESGHRQDESTPAAPDLDPSRAAESLLDGDS